MVLSILFAAIYGIKLADIYPIDTLIHAIDLFPRYGVQPKAYVWPSASIYQAIRDQTPLAPFQVYALASRYDLEELAVAASQYLLNLCLQSITDEMTDLVHPKYLLRLFHLHSKRKDALRNILSEPLETHSPTLSCNYSAYERLQRAWFLAVACLLWDAHASVFAFLATCEQDLTGIFTRYVNIRHTVNASFPSGRFEMQCMQADIDCARQIDRCSMGKLANLLIRLKAAHAILLVNHLVTRIVTASILVPGFLIAMLLCCPYCTLFSLFSEFFDVVSALYFTYRSLHFAQSSFEVEAHERLTI